MLTDLHQGLEEAETIKNLFYQRLKIPKKNFTTILNVNRAQMNE